MAKPDFGSRELTSAQIDTMNILRNDVELLSSKAEMHVKQGRLLSMFQTKLEEAHMILNKAIAHDGLNE